MKTEAGGSQMNDVAVATRFDGNLFTKSPFQKRRAGVDAEVRRASRASVVAVGMRDDRARDGAPWIDVKVAGRAVETVSGFLQHSISFDCTIPRCHGSGSLLRAAALRRARKPDTTSVR